MVTRPYRPTTFWPQWLRSFTPQRSRRPQSQRSSRRRLSWVYPAASLGLVLLLWQTDGHLLLATVSGMGTMMFLSRRQHSLYQGWQHLQALLKRALAHPLAMTVTAGAIACLGTYTLTHLWQQPQDPWLTLALVVQGILLLAVVLALMAVAGQGQQQHQQQQFQQWLGELTNANPLQRLVAVRQLARTSAPGDRRCVQEALYLLLAQESEPTVRRAALDVLDQLDATP